MDKLEYDKAIAKAVGIKEGRIVYTQVTFRQEGKCVFRIEMETTPKQKAKLAALLFSSLKEGIVLKGEEDGQT